jgi:hypothetical protein
VAFEIFHYGMNCGAAHADEFVLGPFLWGFPEG